MLLRFIVLWPWIWWSLWSWAKGRVQKSKVRTESCSFNLVYYYTILYCTVLYYTIEWFIDFSATNKIDNLACFYIYIILIDWHLYLLRVVQSVVTTTAINWSPSINRTIHGCLEIIWIICLAYFSCWTGYLTRSLCSLVRDPGQHSK